METDAAGPAQVHARYTVNSSPDLALSPVSTRDSGFASGMWVVDQPCLTRQTSGNSLNGLKTFRPGRFMNRVHATGSPASRRAQLLAMLAEIG